MQVLAVSMHNPNLLYKLDQSRMDLGCAVQETASDECFRRLVVKTRTCCSHCCEAMPNRKTEQGLTACICSVARCGGKCRQACIQRH